jgi:hypothetical protein
MVNKNLIDMLDTTCSQAARVACKFGSLEGTRHLRNSGVELLRAVRCSLDGVIDLLEPPKRPQTPPSDHGKAD